MTIGNRMVLSVVLGALALIAGAGKKPAAKGFAVVELFTSEGCSSCPPADALVAAVQREDKDQPVYVLAFHVDYWDRLGWKDAFSNAAYSDRQKDYGRWLRLSSIYTPEVVVNGQTEFVGSDARALRQAIANSLQQPATATLTLDAAQGNGSDCKWQASTTGANSRNLRLIVAVVEHNASSQVKAGENGGKTLSHVQIVRSLASAPLDAKGNAKGQLAWPAGLRSGDGEIIAFLQDTGNGKILAATRSSI